MGGLRSSSFLYAAAIATLAASNISAQTCPAPSSDSISCFVGAEYQSSNVVTFCDCSCGTTSSAATDELANGDIMVFQVASSSSCSSTACRATFPSSCSSAPSYAAARTWTLANLNQVVAPLTSAPIGSGTICWLLKTSCTTELVNDGTCPNFLLGITMTLYMYMNTSTAIDSGYSNTAAECQDAAAAGSSSSSSGYIGSYFCNTNLCNRALPTPSPLPAPTSSTAGSNGGLIAAVVILVLIVVLGIGYIYKLKKEKSRSIGNAEQGIALVGA